MNLRGKLILGFIGASLCTLTLFGVVAYTSALDFSRQQEEALLHAENLRLIDLLGRGELALNRLLAPTSQSGDHNSLMVVNRQGQSLGRGQGTAVSRQIVNDRIDRGLDNAQHGSGFVDFNGTEYVWAADDIPGSPYTLVNSYRRSGDLAVFARYIGLPLAIATLAAIWASLWGGMIIASLFKKLHSHRSTLEHQSRHDPLTKLPNRAALVETIAGSIAGGSGGGQLILCIIGLHRFKDINDSLGHSGGDELLNQVSARLRHVSRNTDMVARFGGNKFAVFLNHSDANSVDVISKKLLSALEPAFEVSGHYLYMRGTLGMALCPQHATDALTLVQKAEIAMYQAKDAARDFAVYSAAADTGSIEHLDLANDLRYAIEDDQLELYYQPQLDLRNGIITGVEALCRWTHPKYGFVPPDKFIDIAERTGLIKQLTEWVLKTAIKHCAHWHRTGREIQVSINLSARNLHDEDLVQQVAHLLDHWHVPPQHVALEITETAMMSDPNHARTLLKRLDALGVRISIDDFGTGYSSLGYLKQLPVDEIKIDRSFVLNMTNDENDASIVRATIGLAHDLGLEVVAEGIEDETTQNRLRDWGCDIAQGYHIGRPMPQENLMQLLRAQPVVTAQQVTNTK
jgi:diguanylate cyclase (GGDEF)-like protein